MAGTLILTTVGFMSIEDVRAGDYVYAQDVETGETNYQPVLQTYINQTDELYTVTIDGEEIQATPGHPFYISEEGWVSAKDLEAGDQVTTADGKEATVEEVKKEELDQPVSVYNFNVMDYHTYYVGENGVLVHNANGTCTTATNTANKAKESVQKAVDKSGRTSVTVGDNNQSIVYRVIRNDENPMSGLTAKNPTRGMSIEGHIVSGSRNKGSQFISTTTDINVANKYALQDNCRIVEIDLNKLPSNVNVYDLSTVAGRNTYLKGVTAKNFAAKSSEVLLEGYIPSDAISLR